MAQFTAATCRYMENEDRHSQSADFDYVGENFAATISYTVNYTEIIGRLWFGEKRYFNYYTATCYDGDGNGDDNGGYGSCARYTQVGFYTLNVTLHKASLLRFFVCIYSLCGQERIP